MPTTHSITHRRTAHRRTSGIALFILVAILAVGTSCRTQRIGPFEPEHPEILHTFLERSRICPEGYTVMDVPNFLRAMGMTENPGFITNTSELEAMSRFGGTDPFLVVYGTGNTICMMVNVVFFRDPDRIETFLQNLEARRRLRLAVYEKPTLDGTWIMICAIDPTRTYSEAERTAIRAGLERQHTNLKTRLRFNRLWENPR